LGFTGLPNVLVACGMLGCIGIGFTLIPLGNRIHTLLSVNLFPAFGF
jgi:hypothetical protein